MSGHIFIFNPVGPHGGKQDASLPVQKFAYYALLIHMMTELSLFTDCVKTRLGGGKFHKIIGHGSLAGSLILTSIGVLGDALEQSGKMFVYRKQCKGRLFGYFGIKNVGVFLLNRVSPPLMHGQDPWFIKLPGGAACAVFKNLPPRLTLPSRLWATA